jgi:hypothetical protein
MDKRAGSSIYRAGRACDWLVQGSTKVQRKNNRLEDSLVESHGPISTTTVATTVVSNERKTFIIVRGHGLVNLESEVSK